ncbi:MAG TPA: DNA-binding protein [Polyangia bacterium]|nr:DNA-binding protein [Polyangia bacterium]
MARSLAQLIAEPSAPRRALSGPRSRSLGRTQLTDPERGRLRATAVRLRVVYAERPRTLAECRPGPCPWVSCKHHLYLDVSPAGALTLNFPHLEVWEMAETCSLRVAERGPTPLGAVGRLLNVTDARVCQIETAALAKLRPGAGPKKVTPFP